MKDNKKDYTFFYASLIAILLWIAYMLFLPYLKPSPEDRGIFGDSFGALSTLFSGLAFAGIIATIIMQRKEIKLQVEQLGFQTKELELQRKELELQRKELELTRGELKKSAKAQEASQEALNLQVELMTKQTILNAYLALYSGNLELLNGSRGSHLERDEATRQNPEIRKKVNNLISKLEDLQN